MTIEDVTSMSHQCHIKSCSGMASKQDKMADHRSSEINSTYISVKSDKNGRITFKKILIGPEIRGIEFRGNN